MKYSIDRIEDNTVVLENDRNETLYIPTERFSFVPAEGMVVSVGKKCIRRLRNSEKVIKERNSELLKKLKISELNK